jgi:hypothetical protein
MAGVDDTKTIAAAATAFGGIGTVGIDGIKAVAAAAGSGAIEMAGINLLCFGPPNSLSDRGGHSFSRPSLNLTKPPRLSSCF